MLANFVFLTADDKNGKIKMYFEPQEGGDVLEVAWANEDYIAGKLAEFKVKDVDGLRAALSKEPTQEVYTYEYTDKNGNHHEGYTLDEPFPKASEPDKAIVTGPVVDVRDNGIKVAVTVEVAKGKTFTVIRSYSVYNEASHKYYSVGAKKRNLLAAFGVDSFDDLAGSTVTFVRQAAGSNYYYDPTPAD